MNFYSKSVKVLFLFVFLCVYNVFFHKIGHGLLFKVSISIGRGGSVIELLPWDREVVSSNPACAGRVKHKTLK
jgi:hypothetical protein